MYTNQSLFEALIRYAGKDASRCNSGVLVRSDQELLNCACWWYTHNRTAVAPFHLHCSSLDWRFGVLTSFPGRCPRTFNDDYHKVISSHLTSPKPEYDKYQMSKYLNIIEPKFRTFSRRYLQTAYCIFNSTRTKHGQEINSFTPYTSSERLLVRLQMTNIRQCIIEKFKLGL